MPILPFLFAFLYRACGGAISLGENRDTEARLLFWVMPVTITMAFILHRYHVPIFTGSVLCGLLSFVGREMGHSFAQGETIPSYFEMGLVTYVRLALIVMFPMAYLFFHGDVNGASFGFAMGIGYLAWPASYFSYRMKSDLRLFGITWCVPDDSSWEEFLIGGIYGLAFSILLIL